MTIRSVDVLILDLPTARPHQLAMHTIVEQAVVVACITDENGTEGWAEVATIGGASYGESTPEAIKVNTDTYITPLVIGKNAIDYGKIMHNVSQYVRGNTFAKTLIESALIDLVAKNKNISAHELLGGKIHDSLPIAWTLASGDTAKDIEEAKELLQQRRHNIFKVKIGKGDPYRNVEHVLDIKRAVGDQARLTVDVNQAWDEETAVYCLDALEDGGISMAEQPLPVWNREGMARLTHRSKMAIMADESATTPQEVFQIAKHRFGDSIALKPCKAGGLRETKKVAAIAEGSGLGLYGGTMIESSLGTAVCAHLYATIPAFKFGVELFGPLLFKDDIITNQIDYRNFKMIIPDTPGFGVEVDREKVMHYARD